MAGLHAVPEYLVDCLSDSRRDSVNNSIYTTTCQDGEISPAWFYCKPRWIGANFATMVRELVSCGRIYTFSCR